MVSWPIPLSPWQYSIPWWEYMVEEALFLHDGREEKEREKEVVALISSLKVGPQRPNYFLPVGPTS